MPSAKKHVRKHHFPCAISTEEVLRELPAAKPVTIEAGTLIFREGTKAKDCYPILSGRVRILKRSAKREDVHLAQVKPGEFLGEMAMLSGAKRSASALAVTKVKAIVIDHDDFVALLQAQNPFATRLLHQLGILLAARCNTLLHLIARQPNIVPFDMKKITPLDIRAVLDHVHTLWAV
jgi:CRP-like cAMP-binding protein